jgi:N-methylhydantoinase A
MEGGALVIRVGIDVGGTFTDLFAWDTRRDEVVMVKAFTTPEDPSIGVMNALDTAGINASDIEVLVHGTTVATNALIQRNFPEPVLVTTEGFRDVIEIGRQRRQHLYNPYQVKPKPYVRRERRFVVRERVAADGTIVVPLDEVAGRAVAQTIARLGVRNVAVAFINSYVNDLHEKKMKDIIHEYVPDCYVATSAEVRRRFRELGRFVTTTIRAALYPVLSSYLDNLSERLRMAGFRGQLYILKSNGGMATADRAKEQPEELLLSGPAGGVAAASFLYKVYQRNLIVTDMGGTSFDASLVEEGRGLVRDDYEIEWERPLIVPTLDIRSIGAGGGSVAWIDAGGSLRVGPRSAGSVPGPACYGRGGFEPTVTDANLVLGRLDPTLGGKLQLDTKAAVAAIRSVADRLGLSVEKCAEGVIDIVADAMAAAIRMVSIDRGRDPRDHVLLAIGAAGPMHAVYIAREAGIPRVLIPPFAGVACAFGATVMDVQHDAETTFYAPADTVDCLALNQAYQQLEQIVIQTLRTEGVDPDSIKLQRSAGMRYIGQTYEVTTSVPSGWLSSETVKDVIQAFNQEHRREYGVADESLPVAFVTLRVTGIGEIPKPEMQHLAAVMQHSEAHHEQDALLKGMRDVWFEGRFMPTQIYDGDRLYAGLSIPGPAIIEMNQGTVVLPPGSQAEVDEYGMMIIDV